MLCCSSSIPLHPQGDTEKLAIFGRTRGRRGAELKVMAAVETKVPGYFTERMVVPEDDKDGFGTRTLVLKVRASHHEDRSTNTHTKPPAPYFLTTRFSLLFSLSPHSPRSSRTPSERRE